MRCIHYYYGIINADNDLHTWFFFPSNAAQIFQNSWPFHSNIRYWEKKIINEIIFCEMKNESPPSRTMCVYVEDEGKCAMNRDGNI